jgi:hypothetical protein
VQRLASVVALLAYGAVPALAFVVVAGSDRPMATVWIDVLLATIPMVLLAAFTWRLVWPRWKLVGKLVVHPCIYAILAVFIGHWSVAIAWVHQGVLGLGGHIWFSRRHGFTWYAVEDPERYVALSKRMVDQLGGPASPP